MSAYGDLRVRVVEEVPGVEPRWFVSVPGLLSRPPMFEHVEDACAFCRRMGWDFTVELFES